MPDLALGGQPCAALQYLVHAKYFELRVKEVEEKIINRFQGVQLERFQQAQASWRSLLENDCAIQSDFYEGAGVYTAIISQCLQMHYRARLEILEKYLCPEHNYLNGCERDAAQAIRY